MRSLRSPDFLERGVVTKKMIAVGCVHSRWNTYLPMLQSLILTHKADFLLLVGDNTNDGENSPTEMNFFLEALMELGKITQVVFIAGNHDRKFRKSRFENLKNVHFLESESKTIDGIKFWGGAMTVAYNNPQLANRWDFTTARYEVEKAYFQQIPDDVDVLITHSPPSGVLGTMWNEMEIGSKELRKRLETDLCPDFLVCSHIHEKGGYSEVINKVPCFNVAMMPRLLIYGGKN